MWCHYSGQILTWGQQSKPPREDSSVLHQRESHPFPPHCSPLRWSHWRMHIHSLLVKTEIHHAFSLVSLSYSVHNPISLKKTFSVVVFNCLRLLSCLRIFNIQSSYPQNPKDEQWNRAMDYIGAVSELNYLSQIVVMLYEDPTKDPSSDSRWELTCTGTIHCIKHCFHLFIWQLLKGWP